MKDKYFQDSGSVRAAESIGKMREEWVVSKPLVSVLQPEGL